MSNRHLSLIKDQPNVAIVQPAGQANLGNVWFGALAVFFAGVFYFWAYYFWGNWGRVLTGG